MADTSTPTAEQPGSTPAPAGSSKRRRLLGSVALFFVLAGAAYGSYWYLDAQYKQDTDDAYVAGNTVQVTPQVSGTVTAIYADDTQHVKQGQQLVQLDDTDARLALEQSEAALAQAVRDVRRLDESTSALQANVSQLAATVARAREDVSRRQRLYAVHAVSLEELQHAQQDLKSATAALAQAQYNLAASRATVGHTPIADNPQVQAAKTKVRSAFIMLARTKIVAPVGGYVAKRAIQVGQLVAPGHPLMAIVPQDQLWVEANLKEDQLRNVRLNQPATVTADIYGGKVVYHGRVAGVAAGTGSAFSLLPAQNATGNWIKVVQRVPVRIAIDPKDLAAHPLRIGLSMNVNINTHDTSGPGLASGGQPRTYATPVYQDEGAQADVLINQIIRANS
jgi:membrane fusion protein, multidrug efflux system